MECPELIHIILPIGCLPDGTRVRKTTGAAWFLVSRGVTFYGYNKSTELTQKIDPPPDAVFMLPEESHASGTVMYATTKVVAEFPLEDAIDFLTELLENGS